MVRKFWHWAHALYPGQRGTAKPKDTHMVGCLAGLQKPAQSNPRNAPRLESKSRGEHSWGLEGWCMIPGTGQRDSSASRAAGVLLGDWSPASLCCWEPTAMDRNESCFPAEQTACCLCKGFHSLRAERKVWNRARSRISLHFFFCDDHV